MPLSEDDFRDMWDDRIGRDEGFIPAYEMFISSGFNAQGRDADVVNAFEGFIDAFPPESGYPRTKDEADEAREQWADDWDINLEDMDWDAYRDMVHEMDPDTPL